jgi:hypothetical protein
MVVVLQYDSPLALYAKNCSPNGAQCVFIPVEGVGFFTAGFILNGDLVPGAQLGENRVLWRDLTPEIACTPDSVVRALYAEPLGLCVKTSHGVDDISIPPKIRQMQLDLAVAIVAGILGAFSSVAYCCFTQAPTIAVLSAGMSGTASLGIAHCIWLLLHWEATWLYTSTKGFYIPLWGQGGELILERVSLSLNNPQVQFLTASVLGFGFSAFNIFRLTAKLLRYRNYAPI